MDGCPGSTILSFFFKIAPPYLNRLGVDSQWVCLPLRQTRHKDATQLTHFWLLAEEAVEVGNREGYGLDILS